MSDVRRSVELLYADADIVVSRDEDGWIRLEWRGRGYTFTSGALGGEEALRFAEALRDIAGRGATDLSYQRGYNAGYRDASALYRRPRRA